MSDDAATVDRDRVRQMIASGELESWAAAYELAQADRVSPRLEPLEAAELAQRYLMRCVELALPPGGAVLGGYSASWQLAALMKSWRTRGDELAPLLRRTVADLATMYRRGDDATKNRVLCGVIEHAFEEPALRPLFADWQRDRDMREAYKLALDWGTTHEK